MNGGRNRCAFSSRTKAGSRRKNIYDERTLAHLRSVEVSAAYPYPYGFVLGTISGDGDAVDCFVLIETPLPSGTIVECQPVGLLEQIEDGEIDHKVLAAAGHGRPARCGDAGGTEDFHSRRVRACAGQAMEIGRLLDRRLPKLCVEMPR